MVTRTQPGQVSGRLRSDPLEEVFELLHYLKVTVEDIRSSLSASHKPLYTVEEVARLTGRSAYTIRRWVADGRIRATRVQGTGPKGKLLISRDQLHAIITEGLGGDLPAVAVK